MPNTGRCTGTVPVQEMNELGHKETKMQHTGHREHMCPALSKDAFEIPISWMYARLVSGAYSCAAIIDSAYWGTF